MGVCRAFGAARVPVLRIALLEVVVLALAGILLGLPLALALSRLVESQLLASHNGPAEPQSRCDSAERGRGLAAIYRPGVRQRWAQRSLVGTNRIRAVPLPRVRADSVALFGTAWTAGDST